MGPLFVGATTSIVDFGMISSYVLQTDLLCSHCMHYLVVEVSLEGKSKHERHGSNDTTWFEPYALALRMISSLLIPG